MTTSALTECRQDVGPVNPHRFGPKVSRRESMRQMRADVDHDSAHYREVQRQKREHVKDMEVVAGALARVVVKNVMDANDKATQPYYCIPHEAPR